MQQPPPPPAILEADVKWAEALVNSCAGLLVQVDAALGALATALSALTTPPPLAAVPSLLPKPHRGSHPAVFERGSRQGQREVGLKLSADELLAELTCSNY